MQNIIHVLLGASIALMSSISSSLGDVTCLDQNGHAVDWFVVYKLPLLETFGKKHIEGGVAQVYMDNKSGQWSMLDQPIDGKNHPVFYTLNQIYSSAQLKKQGGASDVMYVMYNDEIPEGNGSYPYEKGHTKGDICFDKSSGFWLVHSVPKFPPPSSESYGYPSSGHLYGQSMLCVSLKYSDLNTIGKQLQYNYPQIYDYSLPVDFVADNAAMADAVKGVHIEDQPYNNRVVLTSLAGNQFISFAKSADFGEDLYDGFVAPSLSSDLLVETWMHGKDNNLPSNCSGPYTDFKHYLYARKMSEELMECNWNEDGADINQPDDNGVTSLMRAVQDTELCRYLIEHGANVNLQVNEGDTSVHYECEEWDTVTFLLERGADLNLLISQSAHVDAKNNLGDNAAKGLELKLLQHINLQCLAAAAIKQHSVPYEGCIPDNLSSFVQMH